MRLWTRLQLAWMTMSPLPRAVLTTALVLGAAYGIVAAVVLLPKDGALIFVYLLPGIVVVAAIWCIDHGEPSDQTAVHQPPVADVQKESQNGDPEVADPEVADPEAADLVPIGTTPREMSDADFDALEDSVDQLAGVPSASSAAGLPSAEPLTADAIGEQRFMKLVSQAIDDLPPKFARALDHVAVTVSDQGSVQRRNGKLQPLYGLYVGYAGRGSWFGSPRIGGAQPDRIVIFRDTLTHDFGGNPDRLREEVTRTLRHELAHHLGYNEPGVRSLGL